MKPITQWFKRAPNQAPSSERRKSPRRKIAGLHAHYWDGGAPQAHGIVEISGTGLYVATDERWYVGTLVTMTLQIANADESDRDRCITVRGKVVRAGADGVALAFTLPETPKGGSRREREEAARNSPQAFLHRFLAHAGHDGVDDPGNIESGSTLKDA